MNDLYQQEAEVLKVLQQKIDGGDISIKDIQEFKLNYESLFEESRMLMKISDRLQKKLDTANKKISEKNDEILLKNQNLKEAIDKLVQARVGKKASTIMFTAAIILFVSEEIYLEPLVEYFVNYHYLILILKGGVALSLKFFESILESYFVNSEKKRILKESKKGELLAESSPANSVLSLEKG